MLSFSGEGEREKREEREACRLWQCERRDFHVKRETKVVERVRRVSPLPVASGCFRLLPATMALDPRESILRMARLIDHAEERERARQRRKASVESSFSQQQQEKEEEEEEEEAAAAGGKDDSDALGGHWEQRLWADAIQRLDTETFVGLVPEEMRPSIEWSPKLHVPRVVRMKALKRLMEIFARVEVFKVLSGGGFAKDKEEEELKRLEGEGLRKALVEKHLPRLVKEQGLVERTVSQAVAMETKLYDASKSKQVYRNLISSASSKLKLMPKLETECAGVEEEEEEEEEKAACAGEVEEKKDQAEPDGVVDVAKPVNGSALHENILVTSVGGGDQDERKQLPSRSQESDDDFEVSLSTPHHSLHKSKARSDARTDSLREMRCRHNRNAANQLRKSLKKDVPLLKDLAHVLQINESIDATLWIEKIRKAKEYQRDLADCGLLSSSSSEQEEEEEIEKEFGKKRKFGASSFPSPPDTSKRFHTQLLEKEVQSFVKAHLDRYLEKGILSPREFERISEKSTLKVMSKHRGSKDSSFLKKESGRIQHLLDEYVAKLQAAKAAQ